MTQPHETHHLQEQDQNRLEASRVIGNPGMPTDSIDDSSQLVKGCPCYREFGDEKVCLNNDSILPINAISVDPSFFNQLDSKAMLDEYKSDNKRDQKSVV